MQSIGWSLTIVAQPVGARDQPRRSSSETLAPIVPGAWAAWAAKAGAADPEGDRTAAESTGPGTSGGPRRRFWRAAILGTRG
jgi:hypothetical protein